MTSRKRGTEIQSFSKAKAKVKKRKVPDKTQSITSFFRPESDSAPTSPRSEQIVDEENELTKEPESPANDVQTTGRNADTYPARSVDLLQDFQVNIPSVHDRVYHKRPREINVR